MTNTKMLLKKLNENGLKMSYIAKELGLTPYGFSKKVYNESEFKASEIVKCSELLRLSLQERDSIFLN